MNNYSKPTNSTGFVSYLYSPLQNPVLRILYHKLHIHKSRKIIVRDTKIKELQTILKTEKHPKMIVEKSIEKALTIAREEIRRVKLKKRRYFIIYIYI